MEEGSELCERRKTVGFRGAKRAQSHNGYFFIFEISWRIHEYIVARAYNSAHENIAWYYTLMRSNHKGFTFVEAIVVISILSLLSIAVFNQIKSSRVTARNQKRLDDIHHYVYSLELYRLAHKAYPPTETEIDPYCLGEGYPDQTCVLVLPYAESSKLTKALRPHLAKQPVDINPIIINRDYYYGYGYECFDLIDEDNCRKSAISFWLEGSNQTCPQGQGQTLQSTVSGNTYCRLNFEIKK